MIIKQDKLLALYRREWFRRVFRPFVRPISPDKWVFILGCYNSGTTLLDHLLAQHPEISNLPTEGVATTGGLPVPESYGWPRLWYKCKDKIEEDFLKSNVDLKAMIKDWSFWYDRKASVLVEKSIANSLRIDWINKNFKTPLFIWIVRNGYCVAEGIRRRSAVSKKVPAKCHGKGYPIEWCAQQWVESNKLIYQKTKALKNVISVRYEDLVFDPVESLHKIYQALPLSDKTVPSLNAFSFHGSTSEVKNMNPSSFSRLCAEDIVNINRIAEDWIRYFEYPVIDPADYEEKVFA